MYAKNLSMKMGAPKPAFTAVYALSLFTFRVQAVDEMLALTFLWVLVVYGRPLETTIYGLKELGVLKRELSTEAEVLGEIVHRRQPGLMTVRVNGEKLPRIGQLVLHPKTDTHGDLGVIADNYRLADQLWSRAIVFQEDVPKDQVDAGWAAPNSVLLCKGAAADSSWLQSDVWRRFDDLLGAVIEKSDFSRVRIEIYRDCQQISEGSLLRIGMGGKEVLYQIINAVTDSEILVDSNRHGFLSIEARKLGKWNSCEHRFDPVPWTPNIYAPVFLTPIVESPTYDHAYVGRVPHTDYGIKADAHKLVTHNTAILGVLGSGKTSLAVELIQRMLDAGIKVWVIDITGQYEPVLRRLLDLERQSCADTRIKNAIENYANKQVKNQESGGNHGEFAKSLRDHINEFICDDEWHLRVFNPGVFTVTRQTSYLSGGSAGIGEMTDAQITRIVAEQLLECLKDKMSDEARLCLVLEEAHSLVPEWNSVSSDGDKNASNGTAKAIMQGRKYGFGCLLITQRTANVTKSILNQCNTVFGMRLFDDTGKDFLSNYFGRDYASMMPELRPRHCIAYGSALNTQTPLIIKLNDKAEFDSNFKISTRSSACGVSSNGTADQN